MTENQGRRRLLKQLCAAGMTTLAGCRWESESSSPLGASPSPSAVVPSLPSPPPSPASGASAWEPAVPPLLVGSDSTFDLSRTLPPSVPRGGTFGIDTSGAPLPAGMTFSPAGVLAVGTAQITTVAGVIFTYEAA
jgi:hypothetical protein